MKTTPFTNTHIALGAKMHEFAGYNMPIEYSGIIDEHLTVCQAVGVFDVSHMGEFWVKGPKALDFLQKVTSNNVAALTPGKIQYTCFPNEQGGIVDDLLATGGTAHAVTELVKQMGGNVIGLSFLIELDGLGGREKLAGYPCHSLLTVPG